MQKVDGISVNTDPSTRVSYNNKSRGLEPNHFPPDPKIDRSETLGGGRDSNPEVSGGAEMATVPGSLIWEIVKRNNCFLIKEFGNGNAKVQFSKERNNLYNVHSFKHSGLANRKTVSVQPGKDNSVVLATTKTRKQNKPALLLNKSVMKKDFRRMAKAVANQVGDNNYRPDLKNAALARLSVVHRSLSVAKFGVKKRNRQAVKIHARK